MYLAHSQGYKWKKERKREEFNLCFLSSFSSFSLFFSGSDQPCLQFSTPHPFYRCHSHIWAAVRCLKGGEYCPLLHTSIPEKILAQKVVWSWVSILRARSQPKSKQAVCPYYYYNYYNYWYSCTMRQDCIWGRLYPAIPDCLFLARRLAVPAKFHRLFVAQYPYSTFTNG